MSDTPSAPAQEAIPATAEITPAVTPETPAAPATTAFDPSAFEAKITAQMDERVKGFQRVIGEKDSRISELERELKTASMSEDERAQFDAQREQEQLEQIMLENELLRLGREYPNEVSLLEKLLNADSVTDYATILHEAFSAASAAGEAETKVPDVDRNNPPAINPSTAGADMVQTPAGVMTREAALEILRKAETLHG